MNELKTIDCRQCIGYKNCPGKEWFSYADIRYCPEQVYFIIRNKDSMIGGEWPTPPEHLRTDIVQKGFKAEAYFEKACKIVGGLEYRLNLTYPDSLTLLSYVEKEENFISHIAQRVLYYITGWNGKGMNYGKWLEQRNRRRLNAARTSFFKKHNGFIKH